MLNELIELMYKTGWKGIEETRSQFHQSYKKKKIISEFIRDDLIGKKRLASMPDRLTNTIETASGEMALRPTVINCYNEPLTSTDIWWSHWKRFMFIDTISLKKKSSSSNSNEVQTQDVKIYEIIQPIKKSKYPAITEEEEKISKPLQVMTLAIFDSILVHMMNAIEANINTKQKLEIKWTNIRSTICNKLNKNKNHRIVEILTSSHYSSHDVFFLQEVGKSFFTAASKDSKFNSLFELYSSDKMERDQNSIVVLKKDKYEYVRDITHDIIDTYEKDYELLSQQLQLLRTPSSPSTSSPSLTTTYTDTKKTNRNLKDSPKLRNPYLSYEMTLPKSLPIDPGDLFVILVEEKQSSSSSSRIQYALASFHGDTNGLSSKLMLFLINYYLLYKLPKVKLLYGLDGNTYNYPSSDQQGVIDFNLFYRQLHMNSCYNINPTTSSTSLRSKEVDVSSSNGSSSQLNQQLLELLNHSTTFHARTYLQAQLNKAISYNEREVKGDRNLKDYILFYSNDFQVVDRWSDNTGDGVYIENMVFPTLQFPSDHGILATVLKENE